MADTSAASLNLPAVVTFADLVDAQDDYRAMKNGKTYKVANLPSEIWEKDDGDRVDYLRLRLNAIAERLGFVDIVRLKQEAPSISVSNPFFAPADQLKPGEEPR